MAIKKVTREVAHYRPAEDLAFRCGNCIHFLPADETKQYGYCGLVVGQVSSAGICDLWEPNPSMQPGDSMYVAAHASAKPGSEAAKKLADRIDEQFFSPLKLKRYPTSSIPKAKDEQYA